MNVKNLQLIANALEEGIARSSAAGLDPEKVLLLPEGEELEFDLSQWTNSDMELSPGGCGTAACAIGFVARTKEVQEAGLRIELAMPAYWNPENPNDFPSYGWRAVSNFLGIKMEQAYLYFDEEAYEGRATALEVLARVKNRLEVEANT